MNQTIYASFTNIEDAERATGALMDFGLKAEDISLIAHESHGHRVPYYSGRSNISENTNNLGNTVTNNSAVVDTRDSDTGHDLHAKQGLSTTTGADATVGAEKGAGIGLGIGVVAALAAMMVPGVGLVVGGGTLALALAGAAATAGAGAVAGGVLGFLKDQGVPETAIKTYTEAYDTGGAILAVSMRSDVSRSEIESVLNKYNAQNVGEYGQVTIAP